MLSFLITELLTLLQVGQGNWSEIGKSGLIIRLRTGCGNVWTGGNGHASPIGKCSQLWHCSVVLVLHRLTRVTECVGNVTSGGTVTAEDVTEVFSGWAFTSHVGKISEQQDSYSASTWYACNNVYLFILACMLRCIYAYVYVCMHMIMSLCMHLYVCYGMITGIWKFIKRV